MTGLSAFPGAERDSALSLPPGSHELTITEVRARFRWASHRGAPRWLWPEVAVEEWMAALDKIAIVIREVLQDGRARSALGVDTAAVGIAGYTSGTAPLLGRWCEEGRIDCGPSVAALLALHLSHNRLRMKRMAERARDVGQALSQQGVAAVVLKGMHTAHDYFPEPGTRPLSDIDLLIAPADKVRAQAVLRACGFEPGPEWTWPFEQTWRQTDTPTEPRSLSLVHADDPWTIDLHTSLNRRYASGSPLIHLDDALDRTGTDRTAQARAPVLGGLPQPMLLLLLAVHASCGLLNMTLIRLTELALVVRRDVANGTLSWEAFIVGAERAGAVGSIYPALKLLADLVPGTVPTEILHWSREDTPFALRRVIDPLTPASAHMVMRCSIAERFMWAPTRWAILRQVVDEIFPPGSASLSTLTAIYRARIMRLARHTLTR